MMKKILYVFLLFCLFGCSYHDEFILDGYFRSDKYLDKNGIQDFTDYCKYYYMEDKDILFENNDAYQEITSENIRNIVSYFENFKGWMEIENRIEEYDFDTRWITEGDYIHIKTKEGIPIGNTEYGKFDNYSVYFYDMESHTLFYIHTNI